MPTRHDLSTLDWTLWGYVPHAWEFNASMETGAPPTAEVGGVGAHVPGSVRRALLEAGVIPDWTRAMDSRESEWVEHRHWVFQACVPDEWARDAARLCCEGLDGSGWVYFNGRRVGSFGNAYVPHSFDVSSHVRDADNLLQIVFDLPPRWLGQLGHSSRIRDLKPRFNYTWDWVPRIVQTGIWGGIVLEASGRPTLADVRCHTSFDEASGRGALFVQGDVDGDARVRVRLLARPSGRLVREAHLSSTDLARGTTWDDVPVESWWPAGCGDQVLYDLRVDASSNGSATGDAWHRRVGFKSVRWEPCDGAPVDSDPWICAVNGRPLFLQGVNWTPVRANFADVTRDDRLARLRTYRDLGCNIVRVWGGAFLPPESFFDDCDELGLLVWQEFPLAASGLGNEPPRDEQMVEAFGGVAASYIRRRQHHASLLMWCGGNELMSDTHRPQGGSPLDATHPVLRRFDRLVAELDPGRRFVPTSSSGPRFMALPENFGRGLHGDVHGPWKADGPLQTTWDTYWKRDDALFRSETGAPGASPVDIIEEFAADLDPYPGTTANPLWQRSHWWIEWGMFVDEIGREPSSLAEYVAWSQQRQSDALATAVAACKRRFPGVGGVIVWMGHDAFPCMANTSILDYHGRAKPAAEAVGRVFRDAHRTRTDAVARS